MKYFTANGFFPLAAEGWYGYLRLTQGCGRSSGVEHNLAKVRVGRSNRLARSNWDHITHVDLDKAAFGRPFVVLATGVGRPHEVNITKRLFINSPLPEAPSVVTVGALSKTMQTTQP